MEPTLPALKADASLAAAFLERVGRECDVPFLRSFPKNSCEAASAVLGLVAHKRYSPAGVRIARGYNATRGDWHFWVEVGNYVVDVTAHQFNFWNSPIVGFRPSPLESEFPNVERLDPAVAIQHFSPRIRESLTVAAGELGKVLSTG